MQMFRKILVGVNLSSGDRLASADLTAPTQEAVKRAIWLAEQLSAELTFMAVMEISAHAEELLHDEFAEAARNAEEAAWTVLSKLIAQAKADNVEATARVAYGRAWEQMVKAVLRDRHDLVIVGTKELGRASRFLFGSTGTKLLRNCPCPVWVTRPDPDWDDLKILVATDLGEVGRKAMKLAIDGAQLAGAKLHVLHAVEDEFAHRMWLTGLSKVKADELRDAHRNDASATLHEQLAETDYRTLPFGVMVHVVEGAAENAILDAIEEHGIDLLVIGTAARSGLSGFLIGNTAERILSQAKCSLLAIKPPDFQCPVRGDEG